MIGGGRREMREKCSKIWSGRATGPTCTTWRKDWQRVHFVA